MGKYKRALAVFLAAAMCLLLCGCDLFAFDTAELLSPPEPAGDSGHIIAALNASVKTDYTLVYPVSGDWRSAIIEEDINGNGRFEAVVFYSTNDDERTLMHMNVIIDDYGTWRSIEDISIPAGGVDLVEFCDLDGNGVSEILVGWEIYAGSERQLAVYEMVNNSLLMTMMQKYTNFVCADLDGDQNPEIFVQELDTANSSNKGFIYRMEKSGVIEPSGTALDNTVKSAAQPVVSVLSDGTPAIYIDEDKGAGAVTEVLYLENGTLINGLLDISDNQYVNVKTLRASSISCKDIDGDGVIEIPVEAYVPNADPLSQENIVYIDWCDYDGKELKVKTTALVNKLDGYMITVPERWKGNIAVSRDTERRRRTVYAFDAETQTVGQRILTVAAGDLSAYKESEENIELIRTQSAVIYALVSDYEGELKIGEEELKKLVKLL